jgi:tetratricopeptide (TPR) repeat protein
VGKGAAPGILREQWHDAACCGEVKVSLRNVVITLWGIANALAPKKQSHLLRSMEFPMKSEFIDRHTGPIIFLGIMFLVSSANGLTEQTQSRPSLHSFDKIAKIMEDSTLVYELGSDENLPEQSIESPPGLSDQALLQEDNKGGYTLTEFRLSEEAGKKFKQAEEAYQAKDYDGALKLYEEVRALQPDYYHVLTVMGDVYYMKGQYKEAKAYYQEAIQHNFADYQAHWFLADADWKLNDQKEAVEQITTAHLLKVNHSEIRKALLRYREKVGRPWKEWKFSPRYSLTQDGKKIKVVSGTEWLGYAAVKAVWKYEPGYAESMVGPDYEKRVVIIEEEKEALIAYLSQEHPMEPLRKIVDDGYTDEFIYYELLAPRAPIAMVLMPRQSFNRILDYIDKYH